MRKGHCDGKINTFIYIHEYILILKLNPIKLKAV